MIIFLTLTIFFKHKQNKKAKGIKKQPTFKDKSEWQQNHWSLKCEIFKTFSKQAREHLQ